MSLTIAKARAILGDDLIGPEEVQQIFGGELAGTAEVPFSAAELEAARSVGDLLIYRSATAGGAPLTIEALAASQPKCFDGKLLRGAGYALKNDWGILLEPLAQQATCTTGWALATADVLPQTLNLSFDEQNEAIRRHIEQRGLGSVGARRRTAVEAVYDTVVCFAARGRHLLGETWDWTASVTDDGGLLQVGGFGSKGMQVLAYSRGTRHGALGACLTRQAES